MGSEQSHLTGIEIDEKSVEVSDFWSQHSASILNSENVTNLTVLIGELFVDGPLWSSRTPLEKASKNLMIYRHPCIIKYISSWQKSSKFYLAIEEVTPLAHVLVSHSTLQICLGLHSILKALSFLHEKAGVSHNNVCIASVYVSKVGSWKLGGTEYLCRYGDLSGDYLKKSRANRYAKAVDPNEEKLGARKDAIDVFAYGVLVCEVLKSKSDEEIPSLSTFRDLCKNGLQHVDACLRPRLGELLRHEFFNHEFMVIHAFLIELPLKNDEEKAAFFRNLPERIGQFEEVTVAGQLGNLLLSRMVLLDKTAQQEVLPFVLCPRSDSEDDSKKLFTEDTFKKYLSPKLLEIFCVRDAQIRLLLLDHFPHFMKTFSKEELQSCILPELLVGVKDTNDHLVAITLRTLAELVPILGAATVIGGKRAKLFNDGRPNSGVKRRESMRKETSPPAAVAAAVAAEPSPRMPQDLPERPRPDGEEGETSTEEVEQSVEEDLDNWEDWDNEDNVQQTAAGTEEVQVPSPQQAVVVAFDADVPPVRKLPDINELDIKNLADPDATNGEDFDFFQDMEPVIETASKYLVKDKVNFSDVNSKLNVIVDQDQVGDGWGEEEWE